MKWEFAHFRSGFLVFGLVAVLSLLLVGLFIRQEESPRSSVEIEIGKQVYAANCASCHGTSGEGQPNWRTPDADGRYPAPPHDSSGHTWHHPDGLLFRYVKHGGASLDIPGFVSAMPAFEGKLSDEEIRNVILYLKTLWGATEREFQAQVSQQDSFPFVDGR